MQTIKIQWIDSSFNNGIWDKNEIQHFGLVTIVTVGFLVEEREDCYIICTEYYDPVDFRRVQAIPKSGIVEVELSRKNKI